MSSDLNHINSSEGASHQLTGDIGNFSPVNDISDISDK